MKPMLQILNGAKNLPQTTLPLLATANDIRGVAHYLKNKIAGATIGEAMNGIKKQALDPRKIAAYESLGIIVKSGDRLRLSSTGRQLARSMEPEAQAFRTILDHIEPYHALLDRVYRQKLDVIVHTDAAAFWSENYPEISGARDEKTMEGYLICFFQLCQAAALGTHIIGKKGQPTRLRVEREELLVYLKANAQNLPTSSEEISLEEMEDLDRIEPLRQPLTEKMRVFISRGADANVLPQVRTALGLVDIESEVSMRKNAEDTTPLPRGVVESMRRCDAGIIVIAKNDCREQCPGECALDSSLQIEIAATFALYDRRVLLLCEKGTTVPAKLKGLSYCEYEGSDLSWDAGVQLIKAIKGFK